MMTTDTENLLTRAWLHSHEEDTATELVFRPATYAFPPSRGRTGYEFCTDGRCTRRGIAARDGATSTEGQWRLEPGPPPKITITLPDGQKQELAVLRIEEDRLVVAR